MKKVLIVGGGVSGLICSYVFKKYRNVNVKIIEAEQVGGEFLAGGLKYIHRTDEMVSMFVDMDLVFSNYTVRGGIMLKETVQPYPACFQNMEKEKAERIQADHYRKTRLAEPGAHAKKAMNDPASTKPRKALRTDFEVMIRELAKRADVIRGCLQRVERNHVYLASGQVIPYDYLVLTIPLWIIRKCVNWYVPHGVAMRLNVIKVVPKRDKYARWDYVYTPYTPADAVHRFSPQGAGYAVEVNGDLDHSKLQSDLSFIFDEGWYIKNVKEGLKGHLLPLEQETEWPENIAPLGRFAKWDSRSTMDVALRDSVELAERWLNGRQVE